MDALYALEREEAIWHTEYEAQNSDVTCIHGRLSKSATTSPVRIPSHTTASPQTCQQWQDDDGASRMMDKAVRNQRRLSGPLSTPNWNLHGSPSVLSPILLPPAYSTNWWQGHDQYLVKWKGLPREENIWEPHAHLDNEYRVNAKLQDHLSCYNCSLCRGPCVMEKSMRYDVATDKTGKCAVAERARTAGLLHLKDVLTHHLYTEKNAETMATHLLGWVFSSHLSPTYNLPTPEEEEDVEKQMAEEEDMEEQMAEEESDLHKEIEDSAASDPDVLEFQQACFHSDASDTGNLSVVVSCDAGEMGGEDNTQVTSPEGFSHGIDDSRCRSHTEWELSSDAASNASVRFSDGSLFSFHDSVHGSNMECELTVLDVPEGSLYNLDDTDLTSLVTSQQGAQMQLPHSKTSRDMEKKKRRVPYVLVPPLKITSSYNLALANPGVPAAFPFVLSSSEQRACQSDGGARPGYLGEQYLKRVFHIDLQKVPGRFRKWSGHGGKAMLSVRHLALDQNIHAQPASNRVIRDKDLESINCQFLPDYDIIICMNLHDGQICRLGVPLQRLFAHCHGTSSMSHKVRFCKKGEKYKQDQLQFIYRILSRYPNIVATNEELRDLRMRGDQFGPIPHLRNPVGGLACTQCDFATRYINPEATEDVLRKHWAIHAISQQLLPRHGEKYMTSPDKYCPCKVQAFDISASGAYWLPVPSQHPSSKPITTAIPSPQGVGSILATSLLCQSSSAPPTLNPAVIIPFLHQSGAVELAHHISPLAAEQLVSLPGRLELELFALKFAVVHRFQVLSGTISTTSTLLRRLLVVPKSGEKRMVDMFNCPSKNTVIAYALEEARLLCFVMRCIQEGHYKVDERSPWEGSHFVLVLTSDQFEAFSSLKRLLTYHHQAPTASAQDVSLQGAISAALKSLYMPTNSMALFDLALLNAVNVYIVLRAIHPDGGFQEAKVVTTYHAKTQFAIRLFLMHHIKMECQKCAKKAGMTEEEQYREFEGNMHDIISRWGTEEHVSPLQHVRTWIRAMSRVARKAPAKSIIMWDPEFSFINVKNYKIVIEDYKAQVRASLQDLIQLVDLKVLLGVELPASAGNLPLGSEEKWDTVSRGHGLFSVSADELRSGNHPSSLFLAELCKLGMCTRVGEKIIWDSAQLGTWLVDTTKAWSITLTLIHLLSLPGRGTEEVIWQHANSPSSPRHLFLSTELQTLVTQSNYNKTTAITGVHKHILRVIPYELACVITKLLRVVRPVEAFAIQSQSTPEQQERVAELYSTHMFVSFGQLWTSKMLSSSLKEWFSSRLGVPLGLNLHRHFAQAMQRKYLLYGAGKNVLGDHATELLGHGKGVAELNYARQGSDLNMSVSDREKSELIGRDWIALHGISTSPPSQGM
ncbi:hypothetical protein BKA82DRAFT_948849 [Pisolithus tinctorius]|uniref:Chromo domain-containing protein n=1 Tax=Pisolithus tinctorius Marx 270 TaxID=870435 RepID=A0A0C3NX30_PISTI|nr:hypothetical protein BKA82DRAFT_948849 [Pisolithus tinctorius]KIO05425.1 hypothetical protein M404DRAFT_948849 [Pisolithus tinctorius Marx 270]